MRFFRVAAAQLQKGGVPHFEVLTARMAGALERRERPGDRTAGIRERTGPSDSDSPGAAA